MVDRQELAVLEDLDADPRVRAPLAQAALRRRGASERRRSRSGRSHDDDVLVEPKLASTRGGLASIGLSQYVFLMIY